MIYAFVGAGGKTSLIKKYAQYYLALGQTVFVTTSTHMMIEKDTLLTDDAKDIVRQLETVGYAMAGMPEGQKIRSLSLETYQEVCRYADVVLIEADGSKHMPLKFPNKTEPVIYKNVDEIVVVCGLHALHLPVHAAVHRWELAAECLNIGPHMTIRAEHIQQLLRRGYMKPLQEKYPDKKITIVPSHNGSLYQRALASLIKADMDVTILKEEWFFPQPHLIICGGGHIAYELAQMAACLDLRIKVIDDRAEFANKDRFPMAAEVICDSFDHLEQYLETNAYYVVVTRGHQHDYHCVRTIMKHSYQYLGMIGSRLKVAKTLEHLKEDGVSKVQIDTLFAPIGMDIKAVTPAEIAISILAQIILEKNKKNTSSVSGELLQMQQAGVLCVIIEKEGSSPRGVGSMMFVNEEHVVDSIGGGTIEFAVVRDARQIREAAVKEYCLNNEESQALGMICGGSNKVLFVPV